LRGDEGEWSLVEADIDRGQRRRRVLMSHPAR
jgi:hypothetical protein